MFTRVAFPVAYEQNRRPPLVTTFETSRPHADYLSGSVRRPTNATGFQQTDLDVHFFAKAPKPLQCQI